MLWTTHLLVAGAFVALTLATVVPKCGKHEFFTPCAGCYVRDDNGDCIPKDECNIQCPEGERFSNCGGCDGSCDMPIVPCTANCKPGSCICDYGFVRGVNGSCVHLNDCKFESNPCLTAQCENNEVCLVEPLVCKKEPCPKVAKCVERSCLNKAF
ncbi:hypothetical protein QR680_006246 [Steinernema hermaphroditum]|uniref:TIL domain-containing protein n=1 Tax=Steinernema hermaphroditum TaxID=289476 RepID=A0AA39HW71_9BILA|nr:hypothetical protein QR680_006246 [Steinernema hermaphroditum]